MRNAARQSNRLDIHLSKSSGCKIGILSSFMEASQVTIAVLVCY